jgi:hypothetical protein
MGKEATYGEIDWNSGDTAENQKTEFMKIEQGKSLVRVMGNPHQFYVNWLELPGGKKTKINSPLSSPALLKRLEDADFGKKPRWIVKVLDRSDDKFKLLEISSQIYKGIRELFNHPKWGPVTGYDVTITRASPGTQPLYTVTPDPKEPLDASLKQAFIEFNDKVDISALTREADPKKVCELLGWNMESESKTSQGKSSAKQQVAASSGDDEDEFFNFTKS